MTEKEITKLKRVIYIWENIGIGMNSTTKEKEIVTKQFLNYLTPTKFEDNNS